MPKVDYQVVNQFKGYEHKKDITNSEPGILVRGTKNVIINDYEKIISRRGMVLKGDAGSNSTGITGSYDDFVTVKGIKIPIRSYNSGSGTTKDIVQIWYNAAWRTITPTTNHIPVGPHGSVYTEWWDSQNQLSRLTWVNGTDKVMSWTGGIGVVSAVSANTISLPVGETWTGNGFAGIQRAGDDKVVINGVVYDYTGGIDTQTLTGVTPSPAAVPLGSLAYDYIDVNTLKVNNVDVSGLVWDTCSTLYNQVYYGNYLTRGIYVSYVDRVSALVGSTIFDGTGLNDAVFGAAGNYLGTYNSTYKVQIDGTSSTVFHGIGLNDAVFSGTSSLFTNAEFKVVIDGIRIDYSTLVGSYIVGESIVGIVSGATGIITSDNGIDEMDVTTTTGTFLVGESITGMVSGASSTVVSFVDMFSWFGNGVILGREEVAVTPIGLIGGISVTFAYLTGHAVYDEWIFNVDPGAGDQDTYQFFRDGTLISTHEPVDTTPTSLPDGINIVFGQLNGHHKNDSWEATMIADINAGWLECGYDNPRKPGQGALLLLDSPPVGMAPQEDKMYINSRSGSWFINQFTLSGDLKSEALNIEKLKSEPQTQIIHQSLLGYIKNSIVFVSKDRTYDTLGRIELVQTPQSLPISDRVRDDFLALDFTNGTQKFFQNKSYITAPNNGTLMVFDHILDLWQPPQTFPIARLAVIDDRICGHSYETNETYVLFEGLTDNGQPIECIALFAYQNFGTRANKKSFNEYYVEGYIRSNTELDTMVRYEIDGCGTTSYDSISGGDEQIVCIGGDDRSLGKRSLGVNSLAALRTLDDPDGPFPKFRVIKTLPRYNFFEVEFGFSSYGEDLKWAILSFGPAAEVADERNNHIKQ